MDGRVLHSGQLVSYKGVMYGGVPNLAVTFGYTNAWELAVHGESLAKVWKVVGTASEDAPGLPDGAAGDAN